MSLLPTAQTMRLGVNALAGRQLFGAEWLSVAIILGVGGRRVRPRLVASVAPGGRLACSRLSPQQHHAEDAGGRPFRGNRRNSHRRPLPFAGIAFGRRVGRLHRVVEGIWCPDVFGSPARRLRCEVDPAHAGVAGRTKSTSVRAFLGSSPGERSAHPQASNRTEFTPHGSQVDRAWSPRFAASA